MAGYSSYVPSFLFVSLFPFHTRTAEMANKQVVLRIRYNMSTSDYPMMRFASSNPESREEEFDWSRNCPSPCYTEYLNRPLSNRPSISVSDDPEVPTLSLAYFPDQVSKTFQDRTYIFAVAERPSMVPTNATIWNLNLKGRRGNPLLVF